MTRTLPPRAGARSPPPRAGAQTKTGTTFGQFLLIEPSASVAAQGNVGATTRSDVLSAYYNPGALGFQTGVQRRVLAQRRGSPTSTTTTPRSRSRWARPRRSRCRSRRSPRATSTSARPSSRWGPASGTRSRTWPSGSGTGASSRTGSGPGAQVKYVQETIWRSSARTVALDAGVIYELPFQAVLGASISNFGLPTSFDGTDLRIRFDQDPDVFGDNDNLPAALVTDDYALPGVLPGRHERAGPGRRQPDHAGGRRLPAERQQQQRQRGRRVDLREPDLGARRATRTCSWRTARAGCGWAAAWPTA